MSIVMKANPLSDAVKLGNGAEICNNTIFWHLKDMGWTPKKMDAVIPNNRLGFFYLGDLYGYIVGLDHYGYFQFRDEIPGVDETVIVLDDPCEHGFIVRDIKGEDRFLCRECDARFPRHPDMIDQEIFRPEEAGIFDSLSKFRDGLITFGEATKVTGLSLEEFKETIAKIFPSDVETTEHYTLGQTECESITINEGPKRTSCPADIDALFSNPEVTLTDIEAIMRDAGVFTDVIEVDHVHLLEEHMMLIEVTFIDGTTQRVEMNAVTLALNKDMLRQFAGSRHHISRSHLKLLPFQYEAMRALTPLYSQRKQQRFKDSGSRNGNST